MKASEAMKKIKTLRDEINGGSSEPWITKVVYSLDDASDHAEDAAAAEAAATEVAKAVDANTETNDK